MGASSASAWRDRSAPVELEVGFVGLDGRQVRMGLAEGVPVRFEAVAPVRAFPSFKRQRYFPGLWWSATTRRHVGYESWLERDRLMLLDHDPAVVGIASQPFWLFWQHDGKLRSHAPDYFARRADGSAVVVDCQPLTRIKPRDAARVRDHPPGLPRCRLGLPACLRPGSGVGRERALAGRLPPSAERPAGGHRGASGGPHPEVAGVDQRECLPPCWPLLCGWLWSCAGAGGCAGSGGAAWTGSCG